MAKVHLAIAAAALAVLAIFVASSHGAVMGIDMVRSATSGCRP